MPAAAGATVGALLVAKVVLIADNLPVINRFPEKPLLYNVAWKTTIYVLAALVVHYLEHLVPVWWRVGNVDGERPIARGDRVAALLGCSALALHVLRDASSSARSVPMR
jgi:hypothetical protein